MILPVMKRLAVAALALAVLACPVLCATPEAATGTADPIVGDWWWIYNMFSVTFNADGTFTATNHTRGTWECVDDTASARQYLLTWKHGKYLDKVVCSADGQQAQVVNQLNGQFSVHRAQPDAPPATPPNPADPVIGDWLWFRGQPVTFKADGTATCASGMHGTWENLHGAASSGKYRLSWDHGRYLDYFTTTPDSRSAHVLSRSDGEYDVHRAPPGQPHRPERSGDADASPSDSGS